MFSTPVVFLSHGCLRSMKTSGAGCPEASVSPGYSSFQPYYASLSSSLKATWWLLELCSHLNPREKEESREGARTPPLPRSLSDANLCTIPGYSECTIR